MPRLAASRITLTYPTLNAALCACFLVTGEDKAGMVARVLQGSAEPRPPAALVRPVNGELVWLLDQAAAAELA